MHVSEMLCACACLGQIQTVKTQEMNLLRDQNISLSVELQQRQAEQESFLAQKDDLSSQLQVSAPLFTDIILSLEKDQYIVERRFRSNYVQGHQLAIPAVSFKTSICA